MKLREFHRQVRGWTRGQKHRWVIEPDYSWWLFNHRSRSGRAHRVICAYCHQWIPFRPRFSHAWLRVDVITHIDHCHIMSILNVMSS